MPAWQPAGPAAQRPTGRSSHAHAPVADVGPPAGPQVGKLQLSNRIAFAPLTRCRAIGNVHAPSAATYYGQRSVQGTLLISEATSILEEARG